MRRVSILTIALIACGGSSFNGSRDEAFAGAVEANVEGEWEDAVVRTLVYLSTATEDDERYDRAQMILASGLEELGLRYGAALYYTDVAQSRRNVELIDEAVAGLERLARGGLVDGDLVLRSFVASEDLSGLRPELADFVYYQRGVDSLRRGELLWANQSFDAISEESDYGTRATLARAAHEINGGELEKGRELLEGLLGDEENELTLADEVRVEARLGLARIALDQERYLDAIRSYEVLQDIAPERPSLLLEMAWAHYYRGNYRRSLGLLVALDAPVYQGLIAPERYLLEAYNLRRLCQLEPARIAARRLRGRHRDALLDLQNGKPPVDSEWLRRAALQRVTVIENARLTRLTREEIERATEIAERAGDAGSSLATAYAWAGRRLERRLRNAVDREARTIASELVAADDGVRLILHELSVQLLRGRSRPSGPPPRDRIGDIPDGEVAYSFSGEFWTDELDDLEVIIEDRCLE
ncbi:MAG: hypothetical protein AAGE52_10385 [Myxococcota bacterium]